MKKPKSLEGRLDGLSTYNGWLESFQPLSSADEYAYATHKIANNKKALAEFCIDEGEGEDFTILRFSTLSPFFGEGEAVVADQLSKQQRAMLAEQIVRQDLASAKK